MLLTLMMNLNMFTPIPPTPPSGDVGSGGGSGRSEAPYIEDKEWELRRKRLIQEDELFIDMIKLFLND